MKMLASGRGGRAECAWADASFFGWITQTRHHVTYPVQRCFPLKIDADLIHSWNKAFGNICETLAFRYVGYDNNIIPSFSHDVEYDILKSVINCRIITGVRFNHHIAASFGETF